MNNNIIKNKYLFTFINKFLNSQRIIKSFTLFYLAMNYYYMRIQKKDK